MHKNAIKILGWVKISAIYGWKLVFSPFFWTFWSVFFVLFWSDIRDFQEKSSGNTDRNLFSFVILWIKEKCYWCRQKVKNSVCLFAIFLIIPFPVLHLLWKSWWQSSLFKTRSKVTSWDLREFHKFFFNMQTWWPFTRNVSYFLWNIFTWLLFFVTPSRITFR